MSGSSGTAAGLAACVVLASLGGCAADRAHHAAGAVDHLLVRVVPEGSTGGRHRIEMRYVSGAGVVRADGAVVHVETGRGGPRGAIVADRIELDTGFAVVTSPDLVAADGEHAALAPLRSAVGDVVGHVTVTTVSPGALDVTFDFLSETANPSAPAGAPPDRDVRRITVKMTDGASALLSTPFLGDVRPR